MNEMDDLREKAEKAAAEKMGALSDNIESLSAKDTRMMLHELHVHQIELEMQNEELRRAQVELDTARARYFDLYDLAPVGYCTLNEKGLILEANLKAANLLGVSRSELVKQPLSRFIHKEDQDMYYLHRKQLFETDEPQEFDLQLRRKDSTSFWAHIATTIDRNISDNPVCRMVMSDITAKKFSEDEHELTTHLILLVNSPGDFRKCISELTKSLQHWSGCEAVGIRLRDGDDYPYYETCGFPARFVEMEKYLCSRDSNGDIHRNSAGQPVLECMCGNVLRGRFDSSLPFFTQNGSFWSNNTSALLTSTTEEERQAHTRNRCNAEGYESVALIPLRSDNEIFGLLQFNDHRPGCFTPELITHFERMAGSLAIALARRQAHADLSESEAKYRRLSENSPAVVFQFMMTPEGVFSFPYMSEAIESIVGVPADEVMRDSSTVLDYIHPDDIEQFRQGVFKSAESLNPYHDIFRYKKDDRVLWIEVRSTTSRMEDGGVLWDGFLIDVTERKQEQDELLRTKENYQTLFNEMLDGFALHELICDEQGKPVDYRFLSVNPAFERLTGLKAEKIIGRSVLEALPGTEPFWIETYGHVVLTGQPAFFANYSDQLKKHFEVTAFQHGPNQFVTIFVDVTKRKQAEEELVRTKDAAEAASRAKSVFLANMSHELRTPLNPIMGFADMLLMDENLTDDQRESLSIISRRSRDLLQLLSDILDIARIEADRIVVHPQRCDIYELIADVADMFRLPAKEKSIEIVTKVAPELHRPLIIDPARLRQILLNLVGNAIKFTDHGDIKICAELKTEDGDTPEAGVSMLHLSVCDTGCGIASEYLDSIFDQFQQVDDSSTRPYGGAGLGLAICKRLVELIGGHIRVESTLGEGSRFYVTLRVDVPHSYNRSVDTGNTHAQTTVPQKPRSVLLVEDDKTSAMLTCRILERKGHKVTQAADGQTGVDICSKERFDLILMDIKMPGMDGYQTTRIIRANEQQHLTPIVAVTACAFDEDRKACLAAGMDDWISKPITADALDVVLASIG